MLYTEKVVRKICIHEVASVLAICEEAAADENKDLVKDLGSDELDNIQICMNLEEELGISIPDEKAIKYFTMKDLIQGVYELVKDKEMTVFHSHLEND